MIVASMTEQEIRKEVLADMANAFRWEDRNQNRFRRLVLKASRFPVFSHYLYTSPRKNKWLILLQANSKKEHSDLCRITFVVTYDSPHGMYAILVSFIDGEPQLIYFAPHFFKRFKERMYLGLTGMELLIEFFRFNSGFVFDRTIKKINESQYFTEIAGSALDGVALGVESIYDNILFKTFVTYEMLKGQQIEKYTENERIRQEIHDI